MLDDISLCADGSRLRLTGASVNSIEYQNVADQLFIVLQLNGEVIKASLFISPTNSSILVERSGWHRWRAFGLQR